MTLHPRHELTTRANVDLDRHLNDWLETHSGLTWLEALRIIHHAYASWLNYALRQERHPSDPERKADEAPDETESQGDPA